MGVVLGESISWSFIITCTIGLISFGRFDESVNS